MFKMNLLSVSLFPESFLYLNFALKKITGINILLMSESFNCKMKKNANRILKLLSVAGLRNKCLQFLGRWRAFVASGVEGEM